MKSQIDPEEIKNYFDQKLETYGASPRGADWNSQASQEIRFEQLVKIIDPSEPFSILDYGCGYGALFAYLQERGFTFHYIGFDISEAMVAKAQALHGGSPNCTFTYRQEDLKPVDYAVASGIFNILFETEEVDWKQYVLKILDKMNDISQKGFSFNMLTQYSDPPYMRPNLYYADPCFYFDHCKTHYARNVALLHDYDLYDFTILVRKKVQAG